MAISKGIDVLVYVDGTAIACQTGASLSMTADNSTYSCKDTTWKGVIVSNLEWSMTCDALQIFNGATADPLFTAFSTGASVTVKFVDSSNTTATEKTGYTGDAYITDITYDASQTDALTVSVSFIGDGALTEFTVGA